MFQDAHIHIQDLKNDSQITRFLEEARAHEVGCFYGCAITPADWDMVESLSLRYAGFIPFFGIHPWFADIAPSGWEERLRGLLERYPLACVGETGLDKTRKNIDMEDQKNILACHLRMARDYHRPFALHSVRAWAEAIALIKEHAPGVPFIAHSFYAAPPILGEVLDLGGYASFSTKQLMRPDEALKELVKAAPIDRILIETDFPYQIKWTSPEDYIEALKAAYAMAADIKGVPLDEFIRVIRHNGRFLASQALPRQGTT